mgnify:FL=1
MTPNEVMSGTTEQVKKVIDQILKIEKSYKHIQNLSTNRSVEAKISEEIIRVFKQEIS